MKEMLGFTAVMRAVADSRKVSPINFKYTLIAHVVAEYFVVVSAGHRSQLLARLAAHPRQILPTFASILQTFQALNLSHIPANLRHKTHGRIVETNAGWYRC